MERGPSGDSFVVKLRLDAQGHILSADDPVLRLQAAAGGKADGRIAIPQLGAIARLARRLGVLVTRPLLIGGQEYDIRLWVRARPTAEGVDLELSEWQEAPHAGMDRFAALRAAQISLAPDGTEWRTDGQMHFLETGTPEAAVDGVAIRPGDLFDDVFLCAAQGDDRVRAHIAERESFYALPVRLAADGRTAEISGHPLFDSDGSFLGYRGKISLPSEDVFLPETVAPDEADVAPAVDSGDESAANTNIDANGPLVGMPDFGRRLDMALRQPLGRIIANAETIRVQLQGPLRGDYTAYAADIASAGRHLMELVDDLADLQAIDRTTFEVAREAIDLADLGRRGAGLLSVKAADRHIAIHAPAADDKAPATGEFRRALQIIVNLLNNAIRYSPEGSAITLSVGGGNGRAHISVTDQGPGIAPEDRERVFEKFERLGRSDVAGSGLGLYISRRLARAMGGDIEIGSPEGQGASFTLWLPGE